MARLRPVDFEDRLTLVEHLDELRTRIVISIVAFSVAFALCFWQNTRLLDIANAPLPGQQDPDHLRSRRAVHDDRDDHRLCGPGDLAAGDPLPGLRVRPAGADRRGRSGSWCPFLIGVPLAVRRGRRLRLLRRHPGGHQVPAQLQRQPVQHPDPGAGLLQLLHADARDHGPDLPAAGRDPRHHPARNRHPRAALRRTAATRSSILAVLAMLAPRHGSGQHADRARAAAPALRGQPAPGAGPSAGLPNGRAERDITVSEPPPSGAA